MEKTITAADANREFSRILQGVREGQSFVVTAHGTPLARIVPVTRDSETAQAAKQRLLEHLRSLPVTDIGRWSRDELYD